MSDRTVHDRTGPRGEWTRGLELHLDRDAPTRAHGHLVAAIAGKAVLDGIPVEVVPA